MMSQLFMITTAGRHSGSTQTVSNQSLMVSDFLTFEWGRLTHGDMYVLIYSNAYMLNFSIPGRPGNFSGQEKIGRDGLEMTTCANKWTGPLTFLK